VIHGRVVGLQARVDVTFRRIGQPGIAIEFVVDTGFEGALALPPPAVAALGLALHQRIISKLADASRKMTDVYRATIDWDRAPLDVAVLAIGDRPLLGTALLDGHTLSIDFVASGTVRIHAFP
jgi:clan AA aspartic protease